MDSIKFSQEYTPTGMMYYEPLNHEAYELMEFIDPQQSHYLNEDKAERVFGWLEKLGHDVTVVQKRGYEKSQRA